MEAKKGTTKIKGQRKPKKLAPAKPLSTVMTLEPKKD